MTTPPRVVKTALDLARMVDELPPVALKNQLYNKLMWQHKYGQRPGHIRQYLEAAHYTEHPRDRQTPEAIAARAKLQQLVAGVRKAA